MIAVASLNLSGCALFEPSVETQRGPLVLQQADEKPVISRSGRFVLQAMRTENQPTDLGAQGQFEWVELRSANRTRQLLLFLNPLGQSGPSIERQLLLDPAASSAAESKWLPQAVWLFDEQGNPLARSEQRSLLAKLVGAKVIDSISDTQIAALLTSVMNLFQATALEQDRHHQRIYSSDALELSVRIVYDAAPPLSEITGAASR